MSLPVFAPEEAAGEELAGLAVGMGAAIPPLAGGPKALAAGEPRVGTAPLTGVPREREEILPRAMFKSAAVVPPRPRDEIAPRLPMLARAAGTPRATFIGLALVEPRLVPPRPDEIAAALPLAMAMFSIVGFITRPKIITEI